MTKSILQFIENAYLFLFIILLSQQEEYVDICFIILGEKEKDLNLKFNKELMFVPNFLRLNISTTENLYDKKLATIKINSYFLAKANHSCVDSFVYEVPWSSQMILTVNMILSWGEQPSVTIDKNKMVVKPEFEESIHQWDGLFSHISLKIFLKHEKFNRNDPKESYLIPKIDWNGNVRTLLPDESYCLRFFTLHFFGILIFAQPPIEKSGIFKYYRLKIKAFSKDDSLFEPNEQIYIGNIFLCNPNLALKDRLKIFIKPQYYKIQFKLIENYDKPIHIAEYIYHRGRFKLNTATSTFSFTYFEMKPAIFSIDLFTNKAGMLLYKHDGVLKICKARIPEIIDNLEVSCVVWELFDDHRVQFDYFKVDMSTHQVGVYKTTRGSESDFLDIPLNN